MSRDHHADGQKDGAKGDYNPPHSITPIDHFIHNESTVDKLIDDNKQYDSGLAMLRAGCVEVLIGWASPAPRHQTGLAY